RAFRAAVEETLALHVAHALEEVVYLETLDALGSDRHFEAVAERNDRLDHLAHGLVALEVANEAAIDLDAVERQRLQLRQAGISRAEIVEADMDAHVLQAGDNVPYRADILVQAALGDFDLQPLGRETGLGEKAYQFLG